MSGPPRAFGENNPKGFKSWIEAYIHHQRYSESPKHFHFWTAVSTICGALRRKVWIDQRQFQWTPNMYILLVGPPGVAAKSTTMRSGMSLLESVEGVKFGPSSGTWQAVLNTFRDAQETLELPGVSEPQAMSCLTIAAGELGTFFRPDDKEFVDLLTAMWDGQKENFIRRTVGQGEIKISSPWLNLIACTTPSWLEDNFREVLIGGGLTSRIVFVYGDKKEQYVAYPGMQITEASFKQESLALQYDLKTIGALAGEYRLNDEAIAWGTSWYERHNKQGVPAHLASGRFDGYMARKQTHIHKLAMVFAASKRNDLIITKDDLSEAEKAITGLEPTMIQVFSSVGVSQGAKHNSAVLTMVKNHRVILNSQLWRLCYKTLSMKDYADAINAAHAAGFITKTPTADGKDVELKYAGAKK